MPSKVNKLQQLVLVLCHGACSMAMGFYREEEESGREDEGRGREMGGQREDWFLLHDSKHVVKTDAGEMRVIKSFGGRLLDRPLHMGFITMEPKTLFVPQYLDSSLVLFIRRGEAKIGLIYKDELAERRLKIGDIYRVPAGSTFYLVNTGEGQRLQVICSIDPSGSLGLGAFQSFFVGGGTNPTSILSGFEPETLATAFNVTMDELDEIMTRQQDGAIVYVDDSREPMPGIWKKFLEMKEQDKLQQLNRFVEFQREPEPEPELSEEQEQATWSLRKFLNALFGQEDKKRGERAGKSPDSYNIYNKSPDFRNNYGWSTALDESDYRPLKQSGIGVYLVNLTAGSMMAPHVNPTATEYGIVLRGTGTIQIVFPNGTQAMNAKVSEGDVFWVPRYFPFYQIASRSGPFEFFGFTTSARKNRPQFLVGASSILRTLRGPEIATSFGTSEDRVRRFIDAQREVVILPSAAASPPDEMMKKEAKSERLSKMMRSLGNEMAMAFD